MPLSYNGTSISDYEVTNIDRFGFWLLVGDSEYFVDFEHYPVFRKATIEQILNMQQEGPGQFHWPDIDADIELDALDYPDQYPLGYKK